MQIAKNSNESIQIRVDMMYQLMRQQVKEFIQDYFINLPETKVNSYDEIAAAIKTHMDKTFGPPWHCCVGKDFGSSVTYNNNHFLYLYVCNKAVMIFKH